MGKDKARKKKTKGKTKDKGTSASQAGSKDAQRAIARAETRLARAISKVEDARGALADAERELTDLLRKHGRLPDDTGAAAAIDPAPSVSAENGHLTQAPTPSMVLGEEVGAAPAAAESDAPRVAADAEERG